MSDSVTTRAEDSGDDQPQFIEDMKFRWSEHAIEDYVVLVVFWCLSIVIFAQFFSRYILNDSIAWTEEIARYLLITVGFLGSSMAVRKNVHIQVEFFYRYLPLPLGRGMSTMVDLVRVVFYGYATYLTTKIIPIMSNQRMTSVDFPMSVLYMVVFVGFAIMTLRALQVTWRHWSQGFSLLDEKCRTRVTT